MSTPDHPQKERVSGVFHRASQTYDTVGVDFFGPLAAALVGHARLPPGAAVLDLGTGTGAALLAAADAVGPLGVVHGVDLAEGMLERARGAVEQRGHAHVSLALGDADYPPAREGGWDAVVASFVLFFLPDPPATVARIRAVLRSGGTFVASSFDAPDERWKVVERAVSPFWPTEEPVAVPVEPGTVNHFASTDAVTALLENAGFRDVHTEIVVHRNVYRDPQQWLAWSWSAGARVIWERVPASDLDAAQAAALDAVATLVEPDGSLVESFTVRLTRALAP
jgi:ubiquinone/menaquinone biosynthesis C-methylase UbiE